MKQNGVRISQCMIVKNEEKNIRRALSWGKDIMFEQIVVDTGSTDRTVEIAEEMGAKVYHFEWIQDFSAAKNFALSKVQGDWVAFLDADEYMTEEWAFKLPELLNELHQTNRIVVSCPWINLEDDGRLIGVLRQWRFFRWLPQLCYQNPIHEKLMFEGDWVPIPAVYDTKEAFPIYHTGYAKSVSDQKNKKDRNRSILEEELKKNPDDSWLMGYLGDCYMDSDEELAMEWFRKAIVAMPQQISIKDERDGLTFIYLLNLITKHDDMEEFWEIYHEAKKRVPWVYDIDYIAAAYLIKREKHTYEEVLYYLQQALQTVEIYGEDAYGVFMFTRITEVVENMALCYYETGNRKACVEQCVGILRDDKTRQRALTLLFRALEYEDPQDILRFLSRLYTFDDAGDRLMILKAAIQAQAMAFLHVWKSVCTQEEQAVIGQAEQKFGKREG